MSDKKEVEKNIIELPTEEYYSENKYQIMKICSKNINHIEVRNKTLNDENTSFTTKDEEDENKSNISYDYEEISYLDLNE